MRLIHWSCADSGCTSALDGLGDSQAARVLGWFRDARGSLWCPLHRTDIADAAEIETEVRGLQGVMVVAGFVGGVAARVSGPPMPQGADLRPAVQPGVVRGTHPPPPGPGRQADTVAPSSSSTVQPETSYEDPELVGDGTTVPNGKPSWAP